MDRLESMAIFLAVVDEGGFAAAARKMKISPPVVTRAVSDLETAIGVRLLTRTTRIVRVTDVGARYAEDCRRVLADITEMEYLRRYPEAEVECRFADRIINMMDEGIDVAVRIGHLPDSSYQAIPVGTVRRVVCASPDYLSKHGTPQVPDDLRQHVTVSSNSISTSPDWRFTKGDTSTLVRVQPRMTVLSNDEAIIAALDGFGITRVLSYMVAPHLSDGRLVEVLCEHETPTLPVHVVQHEGRHAARKVRAFLDLAVGELRGERPAKE